MPHFVLALSLPSHFQGRTVGSNAIETPIPLQREMHQSVEMGLETGRRTADCEREGDSSLATIKADYVKEYGRCLDDY